MRLALLALFACFTLIACTETSPPDAATQAEQRDPKGNPLKGTVLDAQGEALKKARNLEDQMNAAAEQKREEIDAQSE